MAQHDYDIANGTGAAVRSDLNAALAAVLTLNSGASSPSTTQAYMLWADTSAGQLKIRNGANNNWIVIGTLASTNLGLVPNTGGSQANLLGSAAAPSYAFSSDSDTGAFSPTANVYGIATNGVERVRINAAGHLRASGSSGSFSTGPTDAYHEISSGSNITDGLRVYASGASFANNVLNVLANRNTANGTFRAIEYYNIPGGNTRFAVNDAGAILALGTANNTQTINAANVHIDSAGNFSRYTSSRDYKTDIEPIDENCILSILRLQPSWYRSKCDNDNPDWSTYGLIAEDVADVDPRLVDWGYREEDYEIVEVEEQRFNEESGETETFTSNHSQLKDGAKARPNGVHYQTVSVLTLAMVQRLHARVEALEARLAALDS